MIKDLVCAKYGRLRRNSYCNQSYLNYDEVKRTYNIKLFAVEAMITMNSAMHHHNMKC